MLDWDLLIGPVWVTCLIGLTTFILLLWQSTRNHDYWKKRNIPFVKPYPLFGSLLSQITKPFHEAELERYKKLGSLYGHFEGSRALLSVADPALLREIFVKDFQFFTSRRDFRSGNSVMDSMMTVLQGEDWKRVRTIVTPTFTTGKIKKMVAIFNECSKTLSENFRRLSKNGPFDVKRIYGAFTMDVIASSAFSTKLDSHNDPENKFVRTARGVFSNQVNWRFILFIVAPKLMRVFGISIFSPSAVNFFHSATLEIMKERRRVGQTRNDFLQLLMDTAKELSEKQKLDVDDKEEEDMVSNYGESGTSLHVFKSVTKKNLSMDELVAQCIIFFLAGYETTANTLSLVTYNLALYPDIQERLYQEVSETIRRNNGELTYEAIQGLKYLDNVMSETLRLFPPATRLERQADADYKLPNTDITIPKGMVITVPNYAMHRDPKYFETPEKFDPDRFNPEERTKIDPYTYLPFGAGPRNCVGMRFALMEIKVCLVEIVTNFKIKRCSKTKVPLECLQGQGLFQPKEITVEMEPRKTVS